MCSWIKQKRQSVKSSRCKHTRIHARTHCFMNTYAHILRINATLRPYLDHAQICTKALYFMRYVQRAHSTRITNGTQTATSTYTLACHLEQYITITSTITGFYRHLTTAPALHTLSIHFHMCAMRLNGNIHGNIRVSHTCALCSHVYLTSSIFLWYFFRCCMRLLHCSVIFFKPTIPNSIYRTYNSGCKTNTSDHRTHL